MDAITERVVTPAPSFESNLYVPLGADERAQTPVESYQAGISY